MSTTTSPTDRPSAAAAQSAARLGSGGAAALPIIAKLSPNFGSLKGGTIVTITGENLDHPVSVRFGEKVGTISKIVSSSEIQVIAPAGAGVINVFVTTPAGESAGGPETHYTYYGPPSVIELDPAVGLSSGGTTVYLSGKNLRGASSVRFGAADAKIVKVIAADEIEVIAPKGTGAVNVVVTTPVGKSAETAGDLFTYREGDPTVKSLSPSQGPAAGGTLVTITGTNFVDVTAVHFGGVLGTVESVVSPTELMVTSPPGQGVVNVMVTTAVGTTKKSIGDHFSYAAGALTHPHPLAVEAHRRA